MAVKPGHPCAHFGCANLAPSGRKYCDVHASEEPVYREPPERASNRRGYGHRWQKARKEFLAQHPLCVECYKAGRYVKATDVDHIIPHRGDPALFWDRDNWQPLCHSCHSKKTAREDRPSYGRG